MQPLTEFLVNITDAQPNREMGSLHKLKESLTEVGLINPITIDKDRKLIAGRRRYRAMLELGWEECAVRILDPKDEIEAKMISLYENLRRKPLTDSENRHMIAEIDELMRAKHGSVKRGGDQITGGKQKAESGLWSDEKTAEKLGVGRTVVREAKTAEAHVEKHPELAHERTPVVLVHKKREELLATLTKNDRDYFNAQEVKPDLHEIRKKVAQAKEIEEAIEELPDSDFKRTMEKKYRNPYTKYVESPDSAKKAFRKSQGLTATDERKGWDELKDALSSWCRKWPKHAEKASPEFETLEKKIGAERALIRPLTRIDYPIEKFGTQEHAEEFASKHGGYCAGRKTIAEGEIWIIYIEDIRKPSKEITSSRL